MAPLETDNPGLFARRPLIAWLALQVAATLAWEYHTAFYGALLIVTWVGLAFALRRALGYWAAVSALVLASLGLHVWRALPLSAETTPKAAIYQGRSVEISEIRDDVTRVTLDLSRRLEPVPASVSGRLQLSIAGRCLIPAGATVTFKSAAKPPRAYKNPGVFDYRAFLRRSGVYATAFAASCDDVKTEESETGFLDKSQLALIGRLFAGDLKNGPVLSAMLFGTRSIGRDTANKVRDAGLTHLFAISGMQFGVMAAIVFALVAALTGLAPALYLIFPRQKIASAVTLIFIAAYLSLGLPLPSLTRAGIMISAYLAAVLCGRHKDLPHLLLLSACLFLFWRPLDLFHVSFQLSYLCVTVLALVASPVGNFLKEKSRWQKLPRPLRFLAGVWGTTWCLSLMLAPLIALDFGIVNFAGLLHNVWAIPVFDFVLVPLSLAYFALAPWSQALADPVLKIWDAGVGCFLDVLDRVAAGANGNVEIFPPHLEHVAIFYAGIFLAIALRRKIPLLIASILLLLSFAATYYETRAGFDLRVTQIDVGQGDAVLVQSPSKTILIDAGGNARFDIGANVVKPFLKHGWIGTIDAAVITHPDADHYLGFSAVLDAFDVREIWVSDVPETEPGYAAVLVKARDKKIPVRVFASREEIDWDKNLSITVYPPLDSHVKLEDNDRSLVVRTVHHAVRGGGPGFSALFTGDLMRKGENSLLARFGGELKSDLLKVGHHGSKTSTTTAFANAVAPRWATIGVAENSQFGHPHASVLKTLEERGSTVFRTDKHGAITFTVNGSDVSIESFAEN